MKVTTERLPKSLIALDIEPDAALVDRELARAAKRLASKVNIPGFRPGKAPRFIIENYYGKEVIQEEATDEIIQAAFKEALKQEDIEPIAQATIEKLELDPFRFRVLVPVEPTVTLGDYRAIREDYEEEEITDEIVQEAMDQMRDRHVVLQELEEPRPAQEGDQLEVVMDSFVDGKRLAELEAEAAMAEDEDDDEDDDSAEDTTDEVADSTSDADADAEESDDAESDDADDEDAEDAEGEETTLILDEKRLVPELYQGLLGAQAGDELSIDATMPEDHSNELIAGKTVTFKVKVNDIKQRILPDWDELPSLEEAEGDLDTLRAKTRERLERNVRDNARRELVNRFIERVVAETEYDVPDAMIRERAHSLLHEQAEQFARYGIDLDRYLELVGKTHEEAVDELLEPAEESLRSTLALRQILRNENLKLEDSEVDEEVERLLEDYKPEQRAIVRQRLEGDLRPTVAASVLDQKLRDRLVEIATGTAPELTADATAAATDTTSATETAE